MKSRAPNDFDSVAKIGLAMPHVEVSTRYDGAPVLKVAGAFMAGIAMHESAEPHTLVVRATLEDRDGFIEDAPDTYYMTEYYRPHPVVLVRFSGLSTHALKDLLASSYRLALPKSRLRRPQT